MSHACVEAREELSGVVLSFYHMGSRDQRGHQAPRQLLSHLTGLLCQFSKASLPGPPSDVILLLHLLLLTALSLAFSSPYYLIESIFSVFTVKYVLYSLIALITLPILIDKSLL